MLSKEQTFENAEFPVYSSESTNGGVIGYTDNPDFICDNKHHLYLTFGDHTRTFNIAKKSFSVLDNVKVLLPCTDNVNCLLFLIAAWQKQIPNLGYARHWKIAKDCIVQLPEKSKGVIDFDFMDSFVRELERARLRELEAYLVATGLNNYELTATDKAALNNFYNLNWKEFRIDDLYYKVELAKNKFNKKNDTSSSPSAEFSLPIINAKHGDNGIMFYGKESVFPSEEMTIDIVQNGAIATGDVYPQPQRTGILWDAYLIKAKKHIDSRQSLLFFTCSIWKSIKPKFSYEFKATWDRVKKEKIHVPVMSDGKTPDFAAMEQIIAAVQKIVIADVAKYTARNLEATQQVIETKEEQQPAEKPRIIRFPDYQPGRVPLFSIRAACGYFEEGQMPETDEWVDASGNGFTPDPERHFAVYAKGDSMEPKIHDGDICVFEWYKAGSRNGEIVLTQCQDNDPDYSGRYTIKRYHSEKVATEEGWQHSKVELQPLNPAFSPIELTEDGNYRTIGILKCVL